MVEYLYAEIVTGILLGDNQPYRSVGTCSPGKEMSNRENECCSRSGELGCHSHHSGNTHLIIRGVLKLWIQPGERNSSVHGPGGCIDEDQGISYSARAHDLEGCSSVEGPKVLSPTTRDRIERNDVAKAIRLGINIGQNRSIDGGTGIAGAPGIAIGIIHPKCNYLVECCPLRRCNCCDGTTDDDGDSDNNRAGNSC